MNIIKSKKTYTVFFTILLICAGILFYKPPESNYLIQNYQYSAPANKAFIDDNFYKCIVDNYNRINKTNIAYTDNLTDEQLQTITKLDCFGYDKLDDEKIVNVDGLEKLVNITILDIRFNNITELVVSKNIKLEALYDNDNHLNKLNIGTNDVLITLQAYNNQLTKVDLSKIKNLKSLMIGNNQLPSLDVSKNIALSYLDLNNNKLTEIDISNNTDLKTLNISYNNIELIDLSKNNVLSFVEANNNKLTQIDVTKNTKL